MIWSKSLFLDVRTLTMCRQKEACLPLCPLTFPQLSLGYAGSQQTNGKKGIHPCYVHRRSKEVDLKPHRFRKTKRTPAVLEEEEMVFRETNAHGPWPKTKFPWALGMTSRARILSCKLSSLLAEMRRKVLFSFRRYFQRGRCREGKGDLRGPGS